MGRPAVKQAHSDSDGESDDMTDTLELVLTSLRAGGGDGLQLDSLQSVYQHQRRAYLRHKKCAARAADEMHRAVKMIMLLAATPQPPPPPPESPSEPATRSCSVDHTAPSTAHAPTHSEHKQRRIRAPPRSTEGAAYRTGVLASKVVGNDSCGSPSLTPPPHLPAAFQSDSESCDTTVAGPPELQSNNKATRPFQFTTTLRNAFQLKPRAALACQFEGAAEPIAVAYGIDGTIQLWSPQTQKLIQVLHKDQLGMDFAEHLTQATPSLLAAVTGARSTAGSLENQGQLVFIGQKAQPGRLDAMSLGTAQHWPAMPHDGLVSVVEGMMGGRADRGPGRGMMVSGGVRDRKVLIWSLQTSGSRVVDAHVVHQMQTSHGSRVTALCYDPCHARVLSGSESGKVNINDAETGQSVAGGSDDRVQGCVIGHIAMCPTSPHLAMVSCSQADNQLRIMDLRLRRSVAWPALTLGVATGRTQSRYARPAWHPDGGLVFFPLRTGISDTPGDGAVAIWDTRFTRRTGPRFGR
ncbi:hypothetical protein H4R19_003163 [Coemansia spiralis]|nr:hypothetical protein H4R19_003163 [Coemansia spiralis]